MILEIRGELTQKGISMKIVKCLFPLLTIFLLSTCCLASDYWQNDVEYDLDIVLDDTLHQIFGYEKILFRNNSPDKIDHLEMMLYANAFRDTSSAYAREMISKHLKYYFFSHKKRGGWIEVDSLRVDGIPAQLEFFDNHPDLASIPLYQPLEPGESLTLELKFRLKFPATYSRIGRVGQLYQGTQWYPKLAVYDKRGWCTYPYMDMGEFYSEFGRFDVSITLPKNYIVGATGVLQNPSEKLWLDSLAEEGNRLFSLDKKEKKTAFKALNKKKFPSDDSLKTIRFIQDNVHDFAWFACKKYVVQKKTHTFENSGRNVEIWSYSLPAHYKQWVNSLDHLENGLKYYSDFYGEYPYDVLSAVDGYLAGDGMEYPMISVNEITPNEDLAEQVLIHETGHNWFQGILGTDERRYPWLDEGMNTFSTYRTVEAIHSPETIRLIPDFLQGIVKNMTPQDMITSTNMYVLRTGRSLPNNLHSEEYEEIIAYVCAVFYKSMQGFRYLQDYLGDEKFDKIMRTYYEQWKFKHPMPEDFIAIVEEVSGEDMSWFFDDFIGSDGIVDYSLEKIKIEEDVSGYDLSFKVVNKSDISIPYFIEIQKENEILKSFWYTPLAKESSFNLSFSEKPDKVIVDPNLVCMDINTHDNVWPAKLMFKPLFDFEHAFENQLFYSPGINYNFQDGLILSGNVYRFSLTPIHHNFLISGGYGLLSQNPVVSIRYRNSLYARSGTSTSGYGFHIQENYGHRQFKLIADHKRYLRFWEDRQYLKYRFEFNFMDIYESEFFNPITWNTGKFMDVRLSTEFKKNWYLDRINLKLTFTKGIDTGDTESDFSKVEFNSIYEKRLSFKNYFSVTGYFGSILQDTKLPLQELFWGNGGLDPSFGELARFDRSGKTFLSSTKHLVTAGGPMIRGYQTLSGSKYASTLSAEFRHENMGLFGDIGAIENEYSNFDTKYSFGLFMKLGFIMLHSPLFISDPNDGEGKWIDLHNYKKRYYVSITIPNIRFRP